MAMHSQFSMDLPGRIGELKRPMKPIRLVLVDGHDVFRLGLLSLFRKSKTIQVVGEAGDAAHAIRHATQLKPDVVVMDYQLPDASGVEACRKVLAACPDTRVLFLASFRDRASLLSATRAGASGFLCKQVSGEQLLQAVKTIAAGKAIVDPAMTDEFLQLIRSSSDSGPMQKTAALSSQQQRVLALLGDGKTNREIAEILTLSEKTVINYVRILFQKLGFTRRAQAAAYCFRHLAQTDPLRHVQSIHGTAKKRSLVE